MLKIVAVSLFLVACGYIVIKVVWIIPWFIESSCLSNAIFIVSIFYTSSVNSNHTLYGLKYLTLIELPIKSQNDLIY